MVVVDVPVDLSDGLSVLNKPDLEEEKQDVMKLKQHETEVCNDMMLNFIFIG